MSQAAVATINVNFQGAQKRQITIRDGQSIRFGRLENNDCQLDDPSISRAHATLTASNSGVVLSDLSSTNGTFVNGKRISIPVDLQKNDVIDIGPFKITVEIHSAELDKHLVAAGRTMTAQLKPSTSVVVVLKLKTPVQIEGIPEAIFSEQKNNWQQVVTKAVEESGGKIDKVLEDSIIAIWLGLDGVQVCNEAIKTAERLVTITRQLSLSGRWEQYHQIAAWDCVAGISSGLALTGSVGGKEGLRNFAVLGDTINQALQVAQAGKETEARVLVNEQITQILKTIKFNKVLGLEVLGVGQSLAVFTRQ